jgi:hypothetical protein
MSKRPALRRVVALAASYVVALQVVLLGLAPGITALSEPAGILCSGAAVPTAPETPGNGKLHHDDLCCLAAGCSSAAGMALQPGVTVFASVSHSTSVRFAAPYSEPDIWPSERPRSSRAPPLLQTI